MVLAQPQQQGEGVENCRQTYLTKVPSVLPSTAVVELRDFNIAGHKTGSRLQHMDKTLPFYNGFSKKTQEMA